MEQSSNESRNKLKSFTYHKFEEKKIISPFQKENALINEDPSQNPAYKKKKSLKLLTSNSNNICEEPDKFKLFTPQPNNAINDSNLFFLSSIASMSHPPSRKLKTQKSQDLNDFFYQDEVHEVIMKKCGHKNQEDRVKLLIFIFILLFSLAPNSSKKETHSLEFLMDMETLFVQSY